jgi:chaperonin cofactor prefoldin
MKYLLCFFIGLASLTASAQCKLTFLAHDSLAFLVSINNEKINNVPAVNITLANHAAGLALVQMSVPSNNKISVAQELNLKPGGSYAYELMKFKGKYRLQLVSESMSIIEIAPVVELTEPASQQLLEAMSVDSTLVNVVLNDSSLTTRNQANTAEMEALKAEISKINFEHKKLDALQKFTETHHLKVDQLSYLMAQLNLEDNKLKLLQTASENIIDKTNMNRLIGDFLLEKNKSKAKDIINAAP